MKRSRYTQTNDKITLGVKGEVIPYDFTEMGWDARSLVEQLHTMAYNELVTRKVMDSWLWSVRTRNMFQNNKIYSVGRVMHIKLDDVNALIGCGMKTRKEVYEVFGNEFGIVLEQWNPQHYWEKVFPYSKNTSKG